MPISSQVPIIGYVANGVTKSFAFPFAILSADDLKVKVGADVVTTGFSIAGVGDRDGGSVTFTDAPASLTPIILYREVTLDRTTDYQENGDLLAIVLDDDLDRIWMALQDQLLLADRALRSPIGETLQQLPPASERALMALAFDAAGNPIVVRGTNDGGAALALDLLDTAPGKGATLVGADDGGSGTLWTTVAGFIAFMLSSIGASVIGFIQAGVGAVWRSVMDKLRERISPEDFGAVGDDIADDFDALQKAFTRASSIRGAVELSKGKTYKCSGTLNTGNATLVGGGGRPTIHYTGTANLFGNIVRMSGVRITGSGKASTAIGVLIQDGYRNWIEDNQFDNIGKGVQISGSGQTVVGNLFTGCGTGCHVVKYSSAFNNDPTTTFTSRKNWYEDCDNGLWDDATGASSGGLSNCSDNDIFQRNTGYGLRLTSQSFPFTLINPHTEQNSLVAGHYAFGFFNSNVSLVGGYQGASDVNNIDSNTSVTRHTGTGVLAWTRYKIASQNGAKVFLDVDPTAAVPDLQFPCNPANQTVTFVGGGYAATNSARVKMQGGRGDNGNYYGSFIESQRSTSIGNGVTFFIGAIQAGASSDTYTRLVGLTYTGTLYPNADNTQPLGGASNRWSVVYAGTGTINTSDAREKQQIRSLSEAEQAVAVRLKSLIRAFKFNDAVVSKGDAARIHVGVIAQDVKAAFEAEGLVAENYAILCFDEWEEQPEIVEPVLDADGNPTGETFVAQAYRPAGNRYGVRYEELLAFIIGAV